MAVNQYFNHYNHAGEQNLIEDNVIETIQLSGMDIKYITREDVSVDELYGEDLDTQFSSVDEIEMYLLSYESFGGDGDLFGNFGLEVRDTLTMTVSKKRFAEVFPEIELPREGDLLYFPFNKALFEIKFVEDESEFYQAGKRYVYELRCNLFEFNDESFVTGDDEIDDLAASIDFNITDTTSDEHADNREIEDQAEEVSRFDPNNPFGE